MRRLTPTRAGFTLVELLVVIAIITILMGLTFPVGSAIKNQTRTAQTKLTAADISNSIRNYYTDYSRYPVSSQTGVGKDTLIRPSEDNSAIIRALRAQEVAGGGSSSGAGGTGGTAGGATGATGSSGGTSTTGGTTALLNPRKTVYYEGKNASGSGASARGGIDIETGKLLDPWGMAFGIALDTDYSNALDTIGTDGFYSDFVDLRAPRTGVGVFSLGPDGKLGSKEGTFLNSDDIISWQ
jgi:prepilin-type N-terminal cleavage/methylation domain-containing protein